MINEVFIGESATFDFENSEFKGKIEGLQFLEPIPKLGTKEEVESKNRGKLMDLVNCIAEVINLEAGEVVLLWDDRRNKVEVVLPKVESLIALLGTYNRYIVSETDNAFTHGSRLLSNYENKDIGSYYEADNFHWIGMKFNCKQLDIRTAASFVAKFVGPYHDILVLGSMLWVSLFKRADSDTFVRQYWGNKVYLIHDDVFHNLPSKDVETPADHHLVNGNEKDQLDLFDSEGLEATDVEAQRRAVLGIKGKQVDEAELGPRDSFTRFKTTIDPGYKPSSKFNFCTAEHTTSQEALDALNKYNESKERKKTIKQFAKLTLGKKEKST